MFLYTHVTPSWRAIGSRNQKKSEKREKKKRQKLSTVRLRRCLLFSVKNTTISSEAGFSDLKMTLLYENRQSQKVHRNKEMVKT